MAEELNIEIGEIIENTFDYSLPPAELDRRLSEQMERVNRGEIKATHEFAMLGYALDFIDFAKNNVNIEINFGEENLVHYCGIMGALQRSFAGNPPSEDIFESYVKAAAGFFGIRIIKNLGGNWAESNVGMTVIHNGTAVFVQNRVLRYLKGGEDDMGALYNVLKGD